MAGLTGDRRDLIYFRFIYPDYNWNIPNYYTDYIDVNGDPQIDQWFITEIPKPTLSEIDAFATHPTYTANFASYMNIKKVSNL